MSYKKETPAPKKVIIDTDPGIDDAMAIIFAEAHPALDVIGLTTVFGNVTIENGTRNALYLKDRFGMKAPVAQGARKALKLPQDEPASFVHGDSGLGDFVPPPKTKSRPDPRPAYQFIIDTVRASPGEISLIAVGPLTNLALALQAAPDIATLVKEVVVMGGAFGENDHRGNVTPFAEANVWHDPHAADIVFGGEWDVAIIGLDVTEETWCTRAYLDRLRDDAGDVGRFIHEISGFYLRFYAGLVGYEACSVHDSSAVAYAIQPELFGFRKGGVRVVTDGPCLGMSVQKFDDRTYHVDEWSDRAPQRVGVEVQSDALLELYRDTIIDFNSRRHKRSRL